LDAYRLVVEARERGEEVAVCTIVRSQGSTPRRTSSKMLVYSDGRTNGSIGGGELESRILALRDSAKDAFEKTNNTRLTFMPFFVRACADALRAFPIVNSSVDGTSIVLHGEINIGVAVALDPGLIVPVLKGADEKDFAGLQRAVTDLAERARAKKLHPDEVHESTFSITNPGVFGGLMGLPVINQPNVAILAIGAIQKRPVVVNDAVVPRSMVYLTLSYDHRVVDGAVAHQFLGRIKQGLESWDEKI